MFKEIPYNKILSNMIRIQIINIIDVKPATISQIVESINFTEKWLKNKNYDYKAIYKNIKILEKYGFVKLIKKNKERMVG